MDKLNLELVTKFDYLNEVLNKSAKSLFHLKSVGNFINDIDKIKDQNEQFRIASLLFDYLNYVDENPIIDRESSNDLYFKFIAPIAAVYQYQLNYKVYIGYITLVIWLIFANGLLFLVNTSNIILIYLIPNALILFIFIKSIYYTYRKKVFSIRY